ncbi:unnamed protein product [Prorocentrum cordatum]|uniref:Uncharacterized protein n=1 Tax=Prorocentrum cordatum TaxID=2364126 RepID=A0ABN9QYA0_9DINO|nr:unnamed protein product [Polarella glacialis]
MGGLAPAAWTQATADAKRALGDHASGEQQVKHAEGRRKGEKGGKDVMTARVLLLTKLCLSSPRELANLAGTCAPDVGARRIGGRHRRDHDPVGHQARRNIQKHERTTKSRRKG